MAESKKMIKKEVSFMKKKGAPKTMIKHEEAEMKSNGVKKMAFGGPSSGRPGPRAPYIPGEGGRGLPPKPMPPKPMPPKPMPPKPMPPKPMPPSKPVSRMASGGVTRADGVVKKGHTKGKIVKMCYGGKAK